MAEEKKGFSIGGFFKGVKAEFSKIIFPSKETIKKESIAVVTVSLFLGIIIFLLDLVMKYLMGFIL